MSHAIHPTAGARSAGLVGAALFVLAAGLWADDSSTQDLERPTVVLELFTSQGCSSCPAADRLLRRLAESDRQVEIIPLAFHVDYWNYLGWSDPFSSPSWSQRQRRYAHRLGSRSVYTPQLVVNGLWDAVGSNEADARDLIARAGERAGTGELDIEAVRGDDGRVEVRLSAAVATASGEPELWLAVVESGFETPVGRGENARRTLLNDHVVRRLLPTFELTPGARSEGTVPVDLEKDWDLDGLSFAAIVQDASSLEVYTAASTRLED